MTRVFEFITALIIVAILGVVVGVLLPDSGHVQRTTMVSKDIRDVYDVFNNFNRFKDYSVLGVYDPAIQYKLDGKSYGPGAAISWTSNVPKVGDGRLEIVTDKPGFQEVSDQGSASIVWKVSNAWRGHDKHFTIDMERAGRGKNLVKVTWSYDVKYGWNLISRYSSLFIHGAPDSLIQYSLGNIQNLLAAVPNIVYNDLNPELVDTPQQPVLYVSTQAKRNLTEVDAATDVAMGQIKSAMKKLGVTQTGPRIVFTTNFGNQNYKFDVAVPISSSSVTIKGQSYELTAPVAPKLDEQGEPGESASVAESASAAEGGSVAKAGSSAVAESASAPASASSTAANQPPQPGSRDDYGHLVIDQHVRGMLAFGGRALKASWTGSPAGIPPTRLKLEAYAATHGYTNDPVTNRLYDKQIIAYESKKPDGKEVMYDEQKFDIFLPVSRAPQETPEQAAGLTGPAASTSAPAAAGSAAPAQAASVPADADSTD
jgi:hypothetical protein